MSKYLLLILTFLLFNFGFGQNNWTGTINTDWEIAANWSLGHKPSASENVFISANVPNQPVISIDGAVCNVLSISNPTLGNTVSLTVNGTLTVTSVNMNNTGNDTTVCSLNISAGTVNVAANIIMAGSRLRNNITFSGSGTLNIGGTINGGTLNAGTGLVNYNSVGAQDLGGYVFNNVTLSGGGMKTIGWITVNGILSLEGNSTMSASNEPYYGPQATLQYNSEFDRKVGLEWGMHFSGSGGVVISNMGTVTLGLENLTEVKYLDLNIPLIVNKGASLLIALSSTLNLSGDFVNNGGTLTSAGNITLFGTDNQNIGALTLNGEGGNSFLRISKSSGTATLTGNITVPFLGITGTGTLNLGNDLTHTITGNWIRTSGTLDTGSSLLRIGGSITGTGGNFIANAGTVEFYGGNQDLGTVALTYNNLTLSGSGTKAIEGAVINNILSMEGTATGSGVPKYGPTATLQYNSTVAHTAGSEWIMAPYLFTASGGVVIANTGVVNINDPDGSSVRTFDNNVPLTINEGASLNVTQNSNLNFGGDFINKGGSLVSNGPIYILGNAASQNIGSFILTGSSGFVRLIKTAGVATFTGNINADMLLLSSDGGTLDLGNGLTHTFQDWRRTGGTLNGNSSKLKIGGNVIGAGGTFIAGTGTVEFNGVNQNLGTGAITYNNLTLSGSGTKIFGTTAIIKDTFSIDSGVVANLTANLVHTANKLNLGGIPVPGGSWGSTASEAVNTSDIFFISNNGIVNAGPVIAASGTLLELSTIYGTASAPTSFSVSGTAIQDNIVVTPPSGFEISTDNSTFADEITIGTAGEIASTPVYIRLKGTINAGDYSGNIVLSSTGTANINVAVVLSTVTPAALKITPDNKTRSYGEENPILTAAYAGFVNGETVLNLDIKPTITTTAVLESQVDVYPITAAGANSVNYTISYGVDGILTVKALALTVLSNLTISQGTLNPVFAADITNYSAAVANTITNLTVTPTAADGTATLKVNGESVISAAASGEIDLEVGTNVITIEVIAQDKTTIYTITVTRAAPNERGLADLIVSAGVLNPAFNAATVNYTDKVESNISTIIVKPMVIDPTVTVTVNGVSVNNETSGVPITLNTGNNTIKVVVMAQDGTTKEVYTINVERADASNGVIANNILTPNGDGKNDNWEIKDIDLYPNNSVTVYDRAGRIVYSKKNYNNEMGWYLSRDSTKGRYILLFN